MKNDAKNWTKEELKIYILLLCTKADFEESPEDIKLIQSKTSTKIFNKMYKEISSDEEDASFEKIEAAISKLEYSHHEIEFLKREINEVVLSDKKFTQTERKLVQILDNMMY